MQETIREMDILKLHLNSMSYQFFKLFDSFHRYNNVSWFRLKRFPHVNDLWGWRENVWLHRKNEII